ncbi:aspartyl/asparaginyl beta-hydroxylase domain-containing protein [Saccharothrix variisporea]|uniref:Aspartyl/asparaginyl beta-hydroxylase n=1 Tax=Saccharothrix variisporea TaxID=543527 RepID=A0A495X5F6_9PSEU|nr:aspartyl/asparaginyl beta-hydroxylase domain-containing protein [Saccharothrix variisporea]RKT69192.1 aspartyl/asparaginyl beta-hydroxylase [Saccharothrix variisporea]
MQAVDPWPAAPVLAQLPPVARLAAAFDSDALREDLASIDAGTWSAINIMTGDGVGLPSTTLDWRTIPLRSIGGAADRTDPGGPELADFADTPWLDRLPAFREVLAAIPGPLRSARLMALGPGAESPLHSDTKVGLPWGTVRLHVPVRTLPEAILVLDGETYCWEPGGLWYADFTRAHLVRNTGAERRIHLVVDVVVTDDLLALFPPVFREPSNRAGYLVQQRFGDTAVDDPSPVCAFEAPRSFLSFEAADGAHLDDDQLVPMSVEDVDGALVLVADRKPRFRLLPVGDGEFRFAGWTRERTVEIGDDHVTLHTRKGGSEIWSRRVPAQPVGVREAVS